MDLHDLKVHLQRHFSDGLVTIIGSGLSCAEGLPGMGALSKHLESSLGPSLSAADRAKWDEIRALLANGLEAALLAKPPSPTLESAIMSATAELISTHERTVVSEVFRGIRTLRLTKLLKQILKPENGLPIITTNYDRLVEIAAEEAGLGVDTMFVGQFAGALNENESRLSFCKEVKINQKTKSAQLIYRRKANIYKPHGSLDWYHRNGAPVRYAGDLGLPRLIITPGLNKFRNGYDSPFDRHREKANTAIDRAGRFLVIGYGFNDEHLETHLTPKIRAGKPTLLLTHTLSPNAKKLALDHSNVMALEDGSGSGTTATRAIVDRKEFSFPSTALWDLNEFVTEVLGS